jgi:ABC-type multidrug transport system ATPase subunit
MNPYFIAGTLLAVVCAYGTGHWQGDEAGQAKVQAKWDKEKAKLAEEYAANVALMREKEQVMQGNADKLREDKNRELREANARNTALLNSLQHRSNRPESSGVSTTASNGKDGCTGKELYREDGAVLIGIAREADELRISLKQCYAQYEAARHRE